MATELTYLQLKTYLRPGDMVKIAKDHNLSLSQVSRVARGISKNYKVLLTLTNKAKSNKAEMEELESTLKSL